jgi:NAD(P)-dependent dehydrogenase (short-subunit alcohol dehydrogenase family)
VSRSVLITDDELGVGSAVAAAMLDAGHKVTMVYREEPPPAGLFGVRCDVRDTASVDSAFEAARAQHGPVEILVVTAGRAAGTFFTDLAEAQFERSLDVNLTGAYRLTRRALPGMLRTKWGRLIFVSSAAAFRGAGNHADFAASTAGLVGLARSLVRELGPRGVTANVVAPGVLEGDPDARPAERRPDTWSGIPLGRAGTPAEVAAMVGFLAGETTGYVTGAVLPVDGGFGMGN